MLTQEQNDTLCRVGPGTPMGELMRRYWVPALLAWEVPEPDSPPVTIKILGEELVAFRQTDGKVGVVGARCAHRRAHLFWGRNEENGIRCVYHGWKFDCEGNCVDMPSEPEESNFKDRVKIPAYPTVEAGGVVWCYMGPAEKKPAPPLFEWTQVPPTHRAMSKVWQQSNWLQALEGGIDSVHTNFLHGGRPPGYVPATPRMGTGMERDDSLSKLVEVVPTDYGYTYAGISSLRQENMRSVRAYHWVMPWHQIRPGGNGCNGHMWIPIDDENTMVYNLHWTWPGFEPETRFGAGEGGRGGVMKYDDELPIWRRDAHQPVGNGNEFGLDLDPEDNFRSRRNAENKYMIDRQVQKTQTFTGIEGVNTQDRAVQESMGAIADRTLERLGTTDRAIINARRTLLKAAKIVQDGGDPPGISPSYYKLRSIQRALSKDVPWFEALKSDLFQIEEPKAEAAAR